MTLIPKLHFSRYEFKYLLPRSMRDELERELKFFMDLDPYVAQKPGALYLVRSLYFDNPMFTHYYDKIDGQMTRSKLRLRTYSRDPEEGCASFLEIKGRHNNLVFKHRTPMEWGHDRGFIENDPQTIEKITQHAKKGDVLDRFLFDRSRRKIEPVMLIDYLRRPYVSKLDPEFRITFDEQLEARETQTLFPGPFAFKRALVLGLTVMEVKFRFHVPSWFHRIIQSYELRRVSISKICKGIEAFDRAPALE